MITKGGCVMYQNYLITGATGFLGRAVLQLLLAHSCRVLALVMDKDPLAYTIPENVTVFCGDLTDKDTLRSFLPQAEIASACCTVQALYPLPQSRTRRSTASMCRVRRTSSI
ncbi:MAG: SDR family oxidoreductase [Oscillospiraceae bacterium]